MFVWKWILPVYSQTLELETVFRVWDCFLWESFTSRGTTTTATVTSSSLNQITALFSSTPSSANASASSSNSSSASNPLSELVPGEGFSFLFRVALGILSFYQPLLLQSSFEESMHLLQHLPDKAHSIRAQPPSINSGSNGNGGMNANGSSSFFDSDGPSSDEFQRRLRALGPMDADRLFEHIRAIHMEKKIWNQRIKIRQTHTQQQQQHQQQHSQQQHHHRQSSETSSASSTVSKPDFSGQGSHSPKK